jgi:ubiquitin carboxyl-terminal hydrolase 7
VPTPFNSHHHFVLTDEIDAHHRFIAEECDWGFTRFHDLRKLFTGIDGRRPIIENDEAEITVFVRVLKDPTGVLWHNFVKWVVQSPYP